MDFDEWMRFSRKILNRKIEISDLHLREYFSLSRLFLVDEEGSHSTHANTMDFEDFIEALVRIADDDENGDRGEEHPRSADDVAKRLDAVLDCVLLESGDTTIPEVRHDANTKRRVAKFDIV